MANERLVLCGGAEPATVPAPWSGVEPLTLRIGGGLQDVHLGIARLSRSLCAGVPEAGVDLLEIAAFVYAADQAVTRGGDASIDYGRRSERHFRFEIPVRRPDVWGSPEVVTPLADTLSFLTGDSYSFGFTHQADAPRLQRYLLEEAHEEGCEEAILFSGGTDSLCGVAQEVLVAKRRVALVSHEPVSKTGSRQRALAEALAARADSPRLRPLHVGVVVNKGKALGRDFTQRSRSFLFAAIATVVAQMLGLRRARFYENGVVSFNLPVSPQVIGCHASRTTHPRALAGMSVLLSAALGVPFRLENPALLKTKARALEELKAAGHAGLVALTTSCVHTWPRAAGHAHCGRCSQCIDRRVNALSAGLSDEHDPPGGYESDVLVGCREGRDLALVEGYYRTALEVEALSGPEGLLEKFPQLYHALPHLGLPPAEAACRVFSLHQEHARRVVAVVAAEISRRGDDLARCQVPPASLLGLVLRLGGGGGPQPAGAADAAPGLQVSEERFEVRYAGRGCTLGNTYEFRLARELAGRVGDFVGVEELWERVWGGGRLRPGCLQRAFSKLRRRLREDGVQGITIDGSQAGHYRLLLGAGACQESA